MFLLQFVLWVFLLFWLLYEGRRFIFEHDACHMEYIDNIEYLRQSSCADPKIRAQWEGKRVHCAAAEQANAEPRLDCAYRRWWENSGWFTLVQRFTGNTIAMVVVVCVAIFSLAWLLSTTMSYSASAKHRRIARVPRLYLPSPPQQEYAYAPPPQQQQTKIVYLQAAPPPEEDAELDDDI